MVRGMVAASAWDEFDGDAFLSQESALMAIELHQWSKTS